MKKIFLKLLFVGLLFSPNAFAGPKTIDPPNDELIKIVTEFITNAYNVEPLDQIEKKVKEYIDSIEKKNVVEDHIGTQGDTKIVPSDNQILDVFATAVVIKLKDGVNEVTTYQYPEIESDQQPNLNLLMKKIQTLLLKEEEEEEEESKIQSQMMHGVFKLTFRQGVMLVSVFGVVITAVILSNYNHQELLEILQNYEFLNWTLQQAISKIQQTPKLVLNISQAAYNYGIQNLDAFWKWTQLLIQAPDAGL